MKKIKQAIKLILPPILIILFNKFISTRKNKAFKNFKDSLNQCYSKGYSDSRLINQIIYKSALYKNEIDIEKKFSLQTLGTMLTIFPLINKKKISVVDFGGGAGFHFVNFNLLRKILNIDVNVTWNIVETSEMCEKAKLLESNYLKFYTDIQSVRSNNEQIDIVFTSSAIQYHPNPIEALRSLIDLRARYLFITRTPFVNGKENIITIQKSSLHANGPKIIKDEPDTDIYYPITYLSRKSVEDLLSAHYDVLLKTEEGSGVFKFENKEISMDGYLCTIKKCSHQE